MKALDNKNATARRRALKGKQPYYKAVIDYEKTCPFCDEAITSLGTVFAYSCLCSYWEESLVSPLMKRIKKPEENNDLS